jgi:hypothetical protein
MPEVCLSRTPVALREYIPWLWIYAPVVIKWLQLAWRYRCLTLPTVANPFIESGGFRGESKFTYVNQIASENQGWLARSTKVYVPPHTARTHLVERVERAMAGQGLSFPIILKPDIGACGYGVRLVSNARELSTYLESYPAEQSLLVQEYVPWAGEAGVYYLRMPGETRGRIFSLGLRYYPHVVGDGRSTLAELIAADPRVSRRADLYLAAFKAHLGKVPKPGKIVRLAVVASLRVGALYRDGSCHITEALTERLDSIAQSMPEFYCGRFDVRFKSIERFESGKDFRIIEVNGVGAEAIHIWDPELTIGETYRVLFELHEILFEIAAANRARGFRPLNLRELIGLQWKESRLLRSYPISN